MVFAFSDNLSGENSRLCAESGLQRLPLLQCMDLPLGNISWQQCSMTTYECSWPGATTQSNYFYMSERNHVPRRICSHVYSSNWSPTADFIVGNFSHPDIHSLLIAMCLTLWSFTIDHPCFVYLLQCLWFDHSLHITFVFLPKEKPHAQLIVVIPVQCPPAVGVTRHYNTMTQWRNDTMTQWHYDTMRLWHCDTMIL